MRGIPSEFCGKCSSAIGWETDRQVLLQTGCEPTAGNVLSVSNCNTMDLDLQHNYCLMTSIANKIAGSCSWQQ